MCLACSKKNKSSKKRGCKDKVNELINLKLEVYDLFEVTKDSNLQLLEIQLSKWIDEIQLKCPPEDEINLIKEIINQYEHPIK